MTATNVRPHSDAAAVAAAVAAAIRTVEANIATFGDRYPADTTDANRYPLRPPGVGQPEGANVGWTTSFWPGMLWLAHDLTGDDRHLRAALSHVDSFASRVNHGIDLDTHDLGFLYTLACVNPARRTGDPQARGAALAAADHLMTRVLEPAGIIQAWGDLDDPRQRGRTIIDSLMNTPLLFWASHTTGDDRYAAAARRHTAQLRQHILRPDSTTFHTFYWDPDSGVPLRGETEQGHADNSCWARGQAWGIYGFSLNHRHIGDPALLVAASACADRFLAHLPADRVAYWDLEFGDGSGQERDSSAAAIAVCGLHELADNLTDTASAGRYRTAAAEILRSLIDHYSTGGQPVSNALILHGVYDKPKGVGVDEGTLWGDYFYLEALTRATIPGWTSPW
ncbi:unsaturated chondroitin disaccharide hydrolase [Micromonospora matsumotoense]|uniref:Unsaturated chondroitin disaccharide hydrolase n=1 Tax=Micromonospora matsumotoense TaxID=121616 RepID=A0A1C5AXA2_9ACTN|nr:glycoside hydrolase family 88 protein [Micromonospora matsumotoense]SCF49797.1 unsaturated chondroitin disaccharide hydrolase [Micromonospora matsumotoense]